MTVQELIDELNKHPRDMEVRIVLPRRKLYEPEYDFSVEECVSGDWSEHVNMVFLYRGKQLY
jgi:hypothetical protein